MPPCECADKISSTASAEFSDTKVHNVVTRSSASLDHDGNVLGSRSIQKRRSKSLQRVPKEMKRP